MNCCVFSTCYSNYLPYIRVSVLSGFDIKVFIFSKCMCCVWFMLCFTNCSICLWCRTNLNNRVVSFFDTFQVREGDSNSRCLYWKYQEVLVDLLERSPLTLFLTQRQMEGTLLLFLFIFFIKLQLFIPLVSTSTTQPHHSIIAISISRCKRPKVIFGYFNRSNFLFSYV